MAGTGGGSDQAQQNVFVVTDDPDEFGVPAVHDPYILYNKTDQPFKGLYYFDPLDDGLHLLANAVDAVTQSFGALSYDGVAIPLVVGTTPIKITAFDTVQPDTGPVIIVPDAANDELGIAGVGVFMFFAQATASITAGRAYTMEIFVNDQPTGMQAAVDASNQTTGIFVSINAMRGLDIQQIPAVIDLRITASLAGSDFDVVNAEFGMYRISSFGEGLQAIIPEVLLTTEGDLVITTEDDIELALG